MDDVSSQVIFDYIDQNAGKFGIDANLAKRIFIAENLKTDQRGQNSIPQTVSSSQVSGKGATGVMQVLPATHANLIQQGYLPADHRMDTWQSQVDAGLAALKAKSKEHKTSDPAIIAAAYQGGNDAARFVREGTPEKLGPEGRRYQERIVAADLLLNPGRTGTPTTSTPQLARTASNDVIAKGMEAYLDTIQKNSRLLDDLVKSVTTSGEDAAKAKAKVAAEAISAGMAAGQAAEITGTIDAASEVMRERISNLLNLNTRKIDNLVSTELSKQQRIESDLERMRPEIESRRAVGFFDNPIQWLINATILPGEITSYNAKTRQFNESFNKVRSYQTLAKEQQNVDVAGVADLLARKGLITARLKQSEAGVRAAEAEADVAGVKAAAVMQVARLTAEQASQKIQALEFGLRLEERRERGTLKAEEAAELDEINKRLTLVSAAIGAPGMNMTILKRTKDKESKDMWEDATRTNQAGSSFAKATAFIESEGSVPGMIRGGRAEFGKLNEAWQIRLRDEAYKIQTTWKEINPLGGPAPNNKRAREIAAEQMEQSFYKDKGSNMATASDLNPYKVNHKSTVNDYRGDKSNPVFQWVQKQLAAGLDINDVVLTETLRKQVVAGQIDPKVAAAAVAEYYSEAIARNNRARDFTFVGLRPQDDYLTVPRGRNRAVDMASVTSIENWLTEVKIKSMAPVFPSHIGGATVGQPVQKAAPRGASELIFAVPSPEAGK